MATQTSPKPLRFFAIALGVCAAQAINAAPLADLSGGQTGRIEFTSSTPDHRWALIRGRLGVKSQEVVS